MKNLLINKVTYTDVPAVEFPTPSGGTVKFVPVDECSAEPVLQSKTVTPTESQQRVEADNNYDGLSEVIVEGIEPTFIGSSVPRKSASDLQASGKTVTVPSGYYPNQVTKDVPNGSEGTPSANKGTVSNHQVQITPTVTNTGGYISGGTKTGNPVTVSASELVSGSETKTKNGEYDVSNLQKLIVNTVSGDYDVISQSNGDGTQTLIISDVDNENSSPIPFDFSAMDSGTFEITTQFSTTAQSFTHNLGVVPDFLMVYAEQNIAQTYSMLGATRGTIFNWRSGYDRNYAYHGTSTSTVTWANTNANYGISAMTSTTFSLASNSTSYYWRAGTYRYIAIKFA